MGTSSHLDLLMGGSWVRARPEAVASSSSWNLTTRQVNVVDARSARHDPHHAWAGQVAGAAIGCASLGIVLGVLGASLYRRFTRKRDASPRRFELREAMRDVERDQSFIPSSHAPKRLALHQEWHSASHAPSSAHSTVPLSPGHRAYHSAGAYPHLPTLQAGSSSNGNRPLRTLRAQASEPILRMPESFYSSPCFGSSIFSSPGMPAMLGDAGSMTQTTHDASADLSSGCGGIEQIWASSYCSGYPSAAGHEQEIEVEPTETLDSPSVAVTLSRIRHSPSKSAPPRSPTHPTPRTIPSAPARRGSSASHSFSHTSAYNLSKGRARSQTVVIRRSRRMTSFEESQAEAAEADVESGQDPLHEHAVLSAVERITARAYTGRTQRLLANVGSYEQFARLSQAEQERRLTADFVVSYPFITTSQRV